MAQLSECNRSLGRRITTSLMVAAMLSLALVGFAPGQASATASGYFWSSKKSCSFGLLKNATVSVQFYQDQYGSRLLTGYSFFGDATVSGVNMQQYLNGTFMHSVSTDPGHVSTATRTGLGNYFSFAAAGNNREAKVVLTPDSWYLGSCTVKIPY